MSAPTAVDLVAQALEALGMNAPVSARGSETPAAVWEMRTGIVWAAVVFVVAINVIDICRGMRLRREAERVLDQEDTKP